MTTHHKTKPVCRTDRTSRFPRGSKVDTHSTDETPATDAIVSNIHWITDKELALASQDLRRLKRIGRQLEQHGDYFGSGNLAYQLRRIVAEVRDLMRGTSRGAAEELKPSRRSAIQPPHRACGDGR
jgi:hypothetical protein